MMRSRSRAWPRAGRDRQLGHRVQHHPAAPGPGHGDPGGPVQHRGRSGGEDLPPLPLRLPAAIALAPVPAPAASLDPAAAEAGPAPVPPRQQAYDGGPAEFERVVPASGNMQVARRQFWLGPHRSGMTVTFWAGTRVKSLRPRLSAAGLAALAAAGGRPAGTPPLPAEAGAAIEAGRVVSRNGSVHLASQCIAAGEILAGRQVGIRIEATTLMFFDPRTRQLLRTRPSPLSWDQARRLRGARPAGPTPRPSAEPVTVQRVASNTGIIMVTGQKIAPGRIHARQVVTVHVTAGTPNIDLASDDTRTIRRTTTQPARAIKAQQPRKAAHASQATWKACRGTDPSSIWWD